MRQSLNGSEPHEMLCEIIDRKPVIMIRNPNMLSHYFDDPQSLRLQVWLALFWVAAQGSGWNVAPEIRA